MPITASSLAVRLGFQTTARLAVLAGGIAVLSACASDLEDSLSCPNITLLEDTRTLTRMASGSAGVAFEAEIAQAVGTCDYDLDNDTKTGTLDAKITATFNLTRSGALPTNAVSFDYYVAITDPYGEVLNKATFSVPTAFEPGLNRVSVEDDPVRLSIPLKTASVTTRANKKFHIIVGFQLSPNELDYNRKKPRR